MLLSLQILFIGTTELILIAALALLLFGGKKLPEMMRGLGRGVKEFKEGMKETKEPADEAKGPVKESSKHTTEPVASQNSNTPE